MFIVPLLLAVTLQQDSAPRALALDAAALALEPRTQQDPADSLYRAARQALNRGQYTQAAELFRAVRQRYATDALLGEAPDAARIVAALEHEASFRKGERRPIGFGHGAPPTHATIAKEDS